MRNELLELLQLEGIRTEAQLVCELIDLLHLAGRERGERPEP